MVGPSRLRVGVFGILFHASMIALIAILAAARGEPFSEFWLVFLPVLLLASFLVYALVVWPYAARRTRRRGVVLYDSAVGMLAEIVIAVVTAVLMAAVHATPVLRGAGASAYAGAVAEGTLHGLLWTLSDFFIQVLIVGNAAGIAGWYVFERSAQRGPSPAQPLSGPHAAPGPGARAGPRAHEPAIASMTFRRSSPSASEGVTVTVRPSMVDWNRSACMWAWYTSRS